MRATAPNLKNNNYDSKPVEVISWYMLGIQGVFSLIPRNPRIRKLSNSLASSWLLQVKTLTLELLRNAPVENAVQGGVNFSL